VRSRAITSDSGTVCRSLGECSIRTTNMIGDRGTVCIGVPGSLVGVVLTVPGSEYAQSVRSCGPAPVEVLLRGRSLQFDRAAWPPVLGTDL
jgi:hypothetical protein